MKTRHPSAFRYVALSLGNWRTRVSVYHMLAKQLHAGHWNVSLHVQKRHAGSHTFILPKQVLTSRWLATGTAHDKLPFTSDGKTLYGSHILRVQRMQLKEADRHRTQWK